jgi:diacylglycerol kinase (ATP)
MGKNDRQKFSLNARIRSFANAFSGIGTMFRGEHNFRIHIFVFFLVIIAGIFLRITPMKWIMIFIVSGMVLTAECFNTAIEYLADEVSPEYNDRIKKIKDIAAAGVLITAIAAALTGLIIFVPRIIQIIK